jgi:hypothetical protein
MALLSGSCVPQGRQNARRAPLGAPPETAAEEGRRRDACRAWILTRLPPLAERWSCKMVLMSASLRGLGDDALVELRLAEAIAWCSSRVDVSNPAGCFRSDRLKPNPPDSLDGVDSWAALFDKRHEVTVRGLVDPWDSVSAKRREATVRDLVDRRARELGAGVSPVSSAEVLKGGRLLVFYVDLHMDDGASESETGGFIDPYGTPPWDTWVGLFRDAVKKGQGGYQQDGYEEYLISWVPPEFVGLVARAVWVDPVGSFEWLAESQVTVADALRAAHICGHPSKTYDSAREGMEELLRVVGDRNAPWDNRADALLSIRRANEQGKAYDIDRFWCSDSVVSAVADVATDPHELADLQDGAGEALALLWLNRGELDRCSLRSPGTSCVGDRVERPAQQSAGLVRAGLACSTSCCDIDRGFGHFRHYFSTFMPRA